MSGSDPQLSASGAVVVTGLGVVGAFGDGAESLERALESGATSFAPTELRLDGAPPAEPMVAAAIRDFDPVAALGRKGLRALNREAIFLCHAGSQARAQAGLTDAPDAVAGVFVGSCFSGLHDYLTLYAEGLTWGPQRVSPLMGPNTGLNAPAAHVSLRFAALGENHTIAAGAASGLHALQWGVRAVRSGRVERALVGGVDCLSYVRARAAAGRLSPEPPRPFDRSRRGAVPGEAAALLVVESAEGARARGARVLATVGDVATGFAYGSEDERVRSAERVMRSVCGDHRPGVVFASATGDEVRDRIEARAYAGVLGDALDATPVTAIAGVTGDCSGAGAVLQLCAAIGSLSRGRVPPTAGFAEADERLPALRLAREVTELRAESALVTAVDEDGHVAAALVHRGDDG